MFSRSAIYIIRILHTLYKNSISRFFSAMAPGCGCRFFPSCSDYYVEATERHGLLNGMELGIKRVLRCSCLNPGGYDPVPDSCN